MRSATIEFMCDCNVGAIDDYERHMPVNRYRYSARGSDAEAEAKCAKREEMRR
jgi:hypothetical protein